MSSEVIISVRGLRNQFGSNVIHDGLDLEVRRGEILGVIGGSGSGKSVLMRSIIGLRRPDAGEVEIFGQDYWNLPDKERAKIERRWGVMFQDGALFTALSVSENVGFPLREQVHMPEALRDEIADMKLGMVGLTPDDGEKYPAALSGGMRKRVAIARALALDPELLFLDEPTAGLDPLSASGIDELVKSLSEGLRLTIMMVTHDLDLLWHTADRVAVLGDGRIVGLGTMNQLSDSAHPVVRQYFHGARGRAAHEQAALAAGEQTWKTR